jgi:hypothetical protein
VRELAKARKSSSLEVDIKDTMTPKNSILSRIYGLPKIDKGLPAKINSKYYRHLDLPIEKFLAKQLKLLVGQYHPSLQVQHTL